jgi:PRTRC genetic system protein C
MSINITPLKRVFRYDGQELADPIATLTPAQVLDFYSTSFPELINAEVEGPNELDGKIVYTFKRSTGTKGLGASEAEVTLPFVQRLALVAAGQADPLQPRSMISLAPALARAHSAVGREVMSNRRRPMTATSSGLALEALPLLL